MKTTSTSRYLIGILLVILAICSTGFAITLFDSGASTLVSGDPAQTLRLGRSGVPSDWSVLSPVPDPTGSGTYKYHTYTIPASNFTTTPFVQVTMDDPAAGINFFFFVTAHLDSFNPADIQQNYLADEGFSGNEFPGDTGYFQFVMPPGHDLVLVVNDVTGSDAVPPNQGKGKPYRLLVEGFTDTLYSNPSTSTPTPTPKPTTPAISIAVAPASIKEGNKATFTFTASPGAHAAITVNFQMSGQATNGPDYTLTATNVPMGTNHTTATVTLKSKVDSLHEGSETAIMKVLPGTGYTVGAPSQATVLIKDN